VDAQRLLDATRSALAEDGDALLSGAERSLIDKAIETLETALAGTAIQPLKEAQERVNQLTTEFAARRMNNSIQTALTGRTLPELG
jgi:molecular chaperone HscA